MAIVVNVGKKWPMCCIILITKTFSHLEVINFRCNHWIMCKEVPSICALLFFIFSYEQNKKITIFEFSWKLHRESRSLLYSKRAVKSATFPLFTRSRRENTWPFLIYLFSFNIAHLLSIERELEPWFVFLTWTWRHEIISCFCIGTCCLMFTRILTFFYISNQRRKKNTHIERLTKISQKIKYILLN